MFGSGVVSGLFSVLLSVDSMKRASSIWFLKTGCSGKGEGTRDGYDSFFLFDSTPTQKVLILTRLMTHNDFQALIQINSGPEMVF